MLTRLEVDGFKSLRGFALDFEPLMAIVGVNGAGKSNIFDALALLSRLAELDVRAALKGGRGHIRDQFARTENDFEKVISFAAELLLPDLVRLPSGEEQEVVHTRVRYEVVIERRPEPSGTEKVVIARECLKALQQDDDAWMRLHPLYQSSARYGLQHTIFATGVKGDPNPIDADGAYWMRPGGRPQSFLSDSTWRAEVHTPPMQPSLVVEVAAQQALQSWRFLQMEPLALRRASEAADPKLLARDGSNLPTALAALSPEEQAQVRADFVRFVPGVADFEIVQREDELSVEVISTDRQRLPARVLSDGTLRILALLTLLRSAPRGTLLAVEEPENGIYPAHLRELIEEFDDSVSESGFQILLNSHSPAVMAALSSRSGAVVFAEMVRRAGRRATKVRRVRGDSPDRGATTVSPREVEQYLETARPESLP